MAVQLDPPYPNAHRPQSKIRLESHPVGHTLQVGPVQLLRHLQVHPVTQVPFTDVARELQLPSVVHDRWQFG